MSSSSSNNRETGEEKMSLGEKIRQEEQTLQAAKEFIIQNKLTVSFTVGFNQATGSNEDQTRLRVPQEIEGHNIDTLVKQLNGFFENTIAAEKSRSRPGMIRLRDPLATFCHQHSFEINKAISPGSDKGNFYGSDRQGKDSRHFIKWNPPTAAPSRAKIIGEPSFFQKLKQMFTSKHEQPTPDVKESPTQTQTKPRKP